MGRLQASLFNPGVAVLSSQKQVVYKGSRDEAVSLEPEGNVLEWSEEGRL